MYVPSKRSITSTLFLLLFYTFENFKILSKKIVTSVNLKKSTWTAGLSPYYLMDLEDMRKLAGTNKSAHEFVKYRVVSRIKKDLPTSFDARRQWPDCPTIREIGDQGSCGACWALAPAAAMSDRVCIHSADQRNLHISAHNLLTCCEECGDGCYGGDPITAWKYWVEHGIVSGGSYSSHEGCQQYRFRPCSHDMSGFPPCKEPFHTPMCNELCDIGYGKTYKNDLNFGKTWYLVDNNENAIMTEIFFNGPVTASMRMYEDFYLYKTGVYKHDSGRNMGAHAVRILGWGIENDTRYWLVANTFNSKWGDNGFFKIVRGTNECEIEDGITAGLPLAA